jgi:hypothetical protein
MTRAVVVFSSLSFSLLSGGHGGGGRRRRRRRERERERERKGGGVYRDMWWGTLASVREGKDVPSAISISQSNIS